MYVVVWNSSKRDAARRNINWSLVVDRMNCCSAAARDAPGAHAHAHSHARAPPPPALRTLCERGAVVALRLQLLALRERRVVGGGARGGARKQAIDVDSCEAETEA